MRSKVKEFLAEMLVAVMLVSLFCAFVLCFIFVEAHFLKCVVVGILATFVLAYLCWGKELVCE